jgi:hypothetical protein
MLQLSKSVDAMVEHFREHPDLLKMCGSVYLGERKGPEPVDRVDYQPAKPVHLSAST